MERLSGEHSSLHLESDDVRLGGDSEHDGVALLDRDRCPARLMPGSLRCVHLLGARLERYFHSVCVF